MPHQAPLLHPCRGRRCQHHPGQDPGKGACQGFGAAYAAPEAAAESGASSGVGAALRAGTGRPCAPYSRQTGAPLPWRSAARRSAVYLRPCWESQVECVAALPHHLLTPFGQQAQARFCHMIMTRLM